MAYRQVKLPVNSTTLSHMRQPHVGYKGLHFVIIPPPTVVAGGIIFYC